MSLFFSIKLLIKQANFSDTEFIKLNSHKTGKNKYIGTKLILYMLEIKN